MVNLAYPLDHELHGRVAATSRVLASLVIEPVSVVGGIVVSVAAVATIGASLLRFMKLYSFTLHLASDSRPVASVRANVCVPLVAPGARLAVTALVGLALISVTLKERLYLQPASLLPRAAQALARSSSSVVCAWWPTKRCGTRP